MNANHLRQSECGNACRRRSESPTGLARRTPRSRQRALRGGVACLASIAAFFGYGKNDPTSSRVRAATTQSAERIEVDTAGTQTVESSADSAQTFRDESSSLWPMEEDEVWPADGYPTRARAVRALGVRLMRALKDGSAKATRMLVATQGTPELRPEILIELRRRAGTLEVLPVPSRFGTFAPQVPPGVEDVVRTVTANLAKAMFADMDVELDVDFDALAEKAARAGRSALSPQVIQGVLDPQAITINVEDQTHESGGMFTVWMHYRTIADTAANEHFVVDYADAPWVTGDPDPDADGNTVFVGRSGLAPTRDQALAEAESRVRDAVGQAVAEQLRLHHLSLFERWLSMDESLKARLDNLRSTWDPQAEFVQRFQTNSGPMFRAAMRSGAIAVPDISRRIMRMVSGTWQWALRSGLALLIMAGLTYIAYRILDAGTRGHFTWRWRFVSGTAFLLAAALTMVFLA